MRSGWTILTLALLVGLALAFRRRWPTLTPRSRLLCLLALGGLLLARSIEDALHWELTCSRLDDTLLWARAAAYILLVVLFTRIRPRALTAAAGAVLLLPLLSASAYLPLERLFDETPRRELALRDGVAVEQIGWSRPGNDNRAVDYTVARRLRGLPFVQKVFRIGRLYRTQCDIDHLSAALDAAGTSLTLHCPSGAAGEAPVDEEIPLTRKLPAPAPAVVPSEP